VENGEGRTISREEAKRRLREGKADMLLRTNAASEGVNFQFCGALTNVIRDRAAAQGRADAAAWDRLLATC
jgi:hypothetical protein